MKGFEKGSDLVRVTDDTDFSYYGILNWLYKKEDAESTKMKNS